MEAGPRRLSVTVKGWCHRQELRARLTPDPAVLETEAVLRGLARTIPMSKQPVGPGREWEAAARLACSRTKRSSLRHPKAEAVPET